MATLAQRFVSAATAVTLLGLSTACSKAAATAPTAVQVSEDKSGTLAVLGTDATTFTVNYAYSGTDATVTLKSITSVATGAAVTTTLGLGFGSVAAFDGSCTRSGTYTTQAAVIGQPYGSNGTAPFGPGNYCVSVFDAGTLTEPVKYTVTIIHY